MNKIIGLDVSKKWLDICVYASSDKPIYYRFLNEQSGHEEFINLIKEQEVKLIVCEPTYMRVEANYDDDLILGLIDAAITCSREFY